MGIYRAIIVIWWGKCIW